MRALAVLALAVAVSAWGQPVGAQGRPPASPPAPHRMGELDCRTCHVGKHQGVVQMYVGMGGRGTPMIPSHMFQVRVECIACHTAPKAAEGEAALTGQTYRPSEAACVGCHGEKYRGLLGRWSSTLTRMREIVGPKVDAARRTLAAADAATPARARARKLLGDADFNLRFVAQGRGVHNVFYAADLLKLANGWADEAATRLGRPRPTTDDTLVRGGYCAVLCHEAAGVKPRPTVTFGGRPLPHVRHVTELGATCTACHSAEVHKAVTAKPATCTACHHSPDNDRCESCHQAQAAFYKGQVQTPVPIAANLMAEAVTCTGCHDWSKKPSRQAMAQQCVGCHEPQYLAILPEWTAGFAGDVRRVAEAVRQAETAVRRGPRGPARTEAEVLLKEARDALALVRRAGAAHNPLAADALLTRARDKAQAAVARMGGRRQSARSANSASR